MQSCEKDVVSLIMIVFIFNFFFKNKLINSNAVDGVLSNKKCLQFYNACNMKKNWYIDRPYKDTQIREFLCINKKICNAGKSPSLKRTHH